MPTVRVAVIGEGERELCLDAGATYGGLLAALSLSPSEAAILVDGTPVPEDREIGVDRVRVLRLVRGGVSTDDVVDGDDRVEVRTADPGDHLDVMRIVDGAVLAADATAIRERIDAGDALVAAVDGLIVGALVRDGDRVVAVATRRRWRGRGVGAALVSAAAAERARLVAEFDPRVRPFYASLGFEIEPVDGDEGRLRGILRP